jgi:hypothetical protein
MKKYTQEEFDKLERDIYRFKVCPNGDYSEIKSFGERCSFGAGCRFENKEFSTTNYFIRINNIGSRGDGCYVFNCKDGLFVRCGCFFGTVDKFIEQVERNHKGAKHEKTYKLAIDLANAQFEK